MFSSSSFSLDNLVHASLKDITEALSNGQTTSVELVKQYLANIEKDNHKGLNLGAVLQTAPTDQLLARAQSLDEERKNGVIKGPLHGIPILIKDNIATSPKMGMNTTAGSKGLQESTVPGNAGIVDTLIDEGSIILGKTNLTHWSGYIARFGVIQGWSPAGGWVKSVFPGKNLRPSGSSSGSAVGIAAGFCSVAIGTDTSGSLMAPARAAGLYALKPSLGLIPTNGVVPIRINQDCIGPMAKTSYDLAAFLTAMVPVSNDGTRRDYTKFAESPLGEYRIGKAPTNCFTPSSVFETSNFCPKASRLWEKALSELGSNLVETPQDEAFERSCAAAFWPYTPKNPSEVFAQSNVNGGPLDLLMATDHYDDATQYLSKLRDTEITSLDKFVQWNKDHPTDAFPEGADPKQSQGLLDVVLKIQGRKGPEHPEYTECTKICSDLAESFVKHLDDNNLDAMIFPNFSSHSILAACGGLPICAVPYSLLENGEPTAVTFIGRKGDEHKLIGIMATCEKLFPPRPVSSYFTEKDSASVDN